MTNKFTEYYSTEEKIAEMSEYVHFNYKMIMTKMQSETRRKLDIAPSGNNDEGYYDLMLSLSARMFNEMVYSACGICKSCDMKITDLLPPHTLILLLKLLKNEDASLSEEFINWAAKCGTAEEKHKFEEFYVKEIEEIRSNLEALPK